MKFRYIDLSVLQTSFLYKKVHFFHFEKGCVEKVKSDTTWAYEETSFLIFEGFNSKKPLGVLEMQFSVITDNETFFRGKLRSKCFLFFLNEFFQIWIMNLSWVFKRVLKNRNGCILFSAQTTILNKNIWHKLRISTISFIESLHPYL